MAFDSAREAPEQSAWNTIASLVEDDGSATHPLVARLASPQAAMRDIADAVHCLCMLHGRHPGVIDHAAAHGVLPPAQEWLDRSGEGFAIERGWLIRLVAAVGPLPSTPGQAETESTISAQRHALEMLAQSDRGGCATGAAIALVLDWGGIRRVLESAGQRLGIDLPPSSLPDADDAAALVASCSGSPGVERAMAFGAQQVLAQHRGLWDLIEARASARASH